MAKQYFTAEETLRKVLEESDDETNDLNDLDELSPSTLPEVEEKVDFDEVNQSFEESCKKRKLLTSKKLVKSIESSLDESNYNPVDLPEKEEILTAYLESLKERTILAK